LFRARQRKASVILMYGAHLVKNGAMRIVNRLIEQGWITHLATNGAASSTTGNWRSWAVPKRAFEETSPPARSARG